MLRTLAGASLVLAAGLLPATATDPLSHSLIHGIFKAAPEETGEGVVLPLQPAQKLASLQDRSTFIVTTVGQEPADTLAFPIQTRPGAKDLMPLADFGEGAFLAAVDLTGSGVSDLIYTRGDLPGWKVLTNGTRLPKPVQGFVPGCYPKASDSPGSELIPADTRAFKADQDLLAAVGDFLGNGTEQLAYTRPGQRQLWIVGTHGVMTMKANLEGIGPTASGARSHWLFAYKAHRKGQRTRLAYYRAGADHLLRLVPKGMEFHSEKVPLKGNWEHLSQAQVDWPRPAPAVSAEPAATAEPALGGGGAAGKAPSEGKEPAVR